MAFNISFGKIINISSYPLFDSNKKQDEVYYTICDEGMSFTLLLEGGMYIHYVAASEFKPFGNNKHNNNIYPQCFFC